MSDKQPAKSTRTKRVATAESMGKAMRRAQGLDVDQRLDRMEKLLLEIRDLLRRGRGIPD